MTSVPIGGRELMKDCRMDLASAMASRVNSPEVTEGIASAAARGSDVEKEEIEENLSAIIGRTGFFHRTMFAYETVAMLCLALHNLVHGASASDEDYWCRLPDPPANRTLAEWRDMNIPREENGTMSRCLVYSEPVGELPAGNVTRVTVPCSARVFNVSDNTVVEVVAMQWRSMYMTFVAYGYIIGVVITVFTLGDNVDWRNKQAIVMLPTTFLLCGFYLLPESPRWSLTNLHVEEAVHAVAYILRCNRATPDAIRAVVKKLRVEPLQTLHGRMSANEDASQYLSHRRKQAPELSSPEKTVWELLVILITQYQFSSLAVGFCWFACSITFYGLALDVDAGSFNNLFQFALVAASPMATYVLIVWLGRRDVLAVSLYIVCVSCIVVAFLPRGISSARFMALSSAWFFSNVAYTVLFVYATEIFPTVIRALSFNLGAGFGRIGTILAPYLYQGTDSKFVSFLILACTCGLSGFLVGKLPNTKEVHLPEIVKPEENLFDFTPMRPHPSRSRGGIGLSPQEGSPNTTLQVPALPKVSTSKLPSPVASTPDQNVSSWDKPQAKHFASSHRQRRRSVKPALKELGRAPTSVVTASETRPSGPKLSFCEPVAGGATQSAPAATSAATEDEKPAVQLADDDAEQKRASLETVPFANEVFREDRPNAESPKGQEGIPFSGTSVDAAKSPSESPGQCRSPPSIVVDPAGTTRPMEGPHLGDPELLSSPSPVAAASTAVATETMERWSATTHHFSPVRDSIPAEVASPTFRRADAETGSPLQAVATIASGGVTPARSSSPSRPTTRRLGVDDVASTAEAPTPPERLEHRDEVGARAVQAMSVREAEPVKKAGTLQSPRHSLEGAGSGVLARPENVDRRLASPLRRHIKNPASPKLKRNKLSKHRLPRGGHHR